MTGIIVSSRNIGRSMSLPSICKPMPLPVAAKPAVPAVDLVLCFYDS